MMMEHLKVWVVESQKEEAAAFKAKVEEGAGKAFRGPGGEETKEKKDTDTKDMTHW